MAENRREHRHNKLSRWLGELVLIPKTLVGPRGIKIITSPKTARRGVKEGLYLTLADVSLLKA